jgi:predicted membrane-bound mannosyltransferase
MKIERRRNRAGVARNPDPGHDNNGSDEAIDGELSEAEEISGENLENGAESRLDDEAAVIASGNGHEIEEDVVPEVVGEGLDGHADGSDNGSSNGNENGAAVRTTRTVIPNLPRRKRRVEPQPQVASRSVAVAPAPVVPAVPSKTAKQPQAQIPAPVSTAVPVRPEAPAVREPVAMKVFRWVVTYENLIYLAIFTLAVVTRFWDVGNRGIHHDESLHSVYSRNLYIGSGYTHDPMMHGPLQFNFIAVMFWLFGATDTTTRFASVFCGIFVVMSPFFLRRQMGRWPALIASFLLLVSPTVLYFSRMAREDSIFSGMEMIMIVGLWRFVSTRRPADFFIFMTGLSLMFTIKETAYLTFAVLGGFFLVLFALQAGYAILGALAGYGAAMGAFYMFINGKMKTGELPKLPDIPATNPDYNTIVTFIGKLFGHPLVQGALLITAVFIGVLATLFITQRRRAQMMDEWEPEPQPVMRRRPVAGRAERAPSAAVATRGSALPSRKARSSVAATEAMVDEPSVAVRANGHVEDDVRADGRWDGGDGDAERMEATEVWDPKRLDPKPGSFLGRYEPGSIPYLVGSLFSRPSVILIGFLIAAAIFIVLYSVFFTDVPRGILSGLFASLGYWMAQQGVERGAQPWFYYLLIIPLYEPIAVFFSFCATIFFAVKGIKGLLRRREERYYNDEPGLGLFNIDRSVPFAKFSSFLPLFLICWLGGVFVLYSWAGEKMPWLTVHMVRPAILLASLFLGALVASIVTRRQERLEWAREVYGYEPLGSVTVPLEEEPVLPQRRPQAQAGVPQRRRSGEAYVPPPPPGPRRRAAARIVVREQEPPWIAWNRPDSKFPAISFLVVFVLLAFAWGLKMNALTAKNDMPGWGVSWVYPALMVILVVAYAVWLGPSRALRYLALGIFSMFFVYQLKSATALAYQHPDVPIEMAVYVQTSPDVTRTVRELNEYSDFASGGKNIKVVYDSFASWPYEWYLRDFKNKQFVGDGAPPTGQDVPVMFLEYAKHQNDAALSDYVVQRYAMRWWFPEELYKNDFMPGLDPKTSPVTSQIGAAVNTSVSSVTDPGRLSNLWSYLVFRKLPKPLGSEDMDLILRKDIAQTWHYLQYNPPTSRDVDWGVRDPNAAK